MLDVRKKKGPLKKPPLRQAGQSLKDQRETLSENIIGLLLCALVSITLAGLEWWKYVANTPPSPWPYTGIAALVLAFVIWRSIPKIRLLRQINQGILGEIHVGQSLETLREKGFKVLHDIPGDGWNIDHVAVGTRGIFAIETKTPSKGHSMATIQYDGASIKVGGFTPDRDPIVQAKAAANWLRDFIERRANRKVNVRPVIVYPNWFVEGKSLGRDVWVENDNGFLKLMDSEREKLSHDDVALITDILADYARGTWQEA
jgi:hypothetical protein